MSGLVAAVVVGVALLVIGAAYAEARDHVTCTACRKSFNVRNCSWVCPHKRVPLA